MKLVFAVLFLCSVAFSQETAAPQSSARTAGALQFATGTMTASANVMHFEPAVTVATKGDDGHWHLAEGKTLDDMVAAVTRMDSDSRGWNSTLSDQTDRLLSELERQQAETRRQRELAEQWRERYRLALQYALAGTSCLGDSIGKSTGRPPSCLEFDTLTRKLQGPLPGEPIKKKRKAGAQPATSSKPDSEKTKK